MSDALQYVFGYGSLARHRVGAAGSPAHAARLRDHRRLWNVAMDNTLDLLGYKHYLDAADGSRPDVFVTFLNLAPAPGRAVNGVAFAVDERGLHELDRRERNYARVDVGAVLEPTLDAPVWAYLGTPAAEPVSPRASRPARPSSTRATATACATASRCSASRRSPSSTPAPTLRRARSSRSSASTCAEPRRRTGEVSKLVA